MLVGEYWHVTKRDGEKAIHIGQFFAERTLCGKWLDGMKMGDETASGISATCGSCRRIFERKRKRANA